MCKTLHLLKVGKPLQPRIFNRGIFFSNMQESCCLKKRQLQLKIRTILIILDKKEKENKMVSSQCQGWSCLSKVDAKPVDVVVYYESFCPDCSDFIGDHLDRAHKEVGEIMNLQLVPYGNTVACVIHFFRNISEHFPLIKCMMTTLGDPEEILKTCALTLGGIDWVEITHWSRGSLGRKLERHMGLRAKSLAIPDDSYLPFVTVNGEFLGNITEILGTDFVNLICRNYQGPFPYGCRREKSHPTHSCRSA